MFSSADIERSSSLPDRVCPTDRTVDDATRKYPAHLQKKRLRLARGKVASIHRVADKVASRKFSCEPLNVGA
jgi:hypothetical protein